jgi:hypothetical protein
MELIPTDTKAVEIRVRHGKRAVSQTFNIRLQGVAPDTEHLFQF